MWSISTFRCCLDRERGSPHEWLASGKRYPHSRCRSSQSSSLSFADREWLEDALLALYALFCQGTFKSLSPPWKSSTSCALWSSLFTRRKGPVHASTWPSQGCAQHWPGTCSHICRNAWTAHSDFRSSLERQTPQHSIANQSTSSLKPWENAFWSILSWVESHILPSPGVYRCQRWITELSHARTRWRGQEFCFKTLTSAHLNSTTW